MRFSLEVDGHRFRGDVLRIKPFRWEWILGDRSGIVASGITLTRRGAIRELMWAAQEETMVRDLDNE